MLGQYRACSAAQMEATERSLRPRRFPRLPPALLGEDVMNEGDGHAPLADRRRDPFDRFAAPVANREDAGHRGLQQVWIAAGPTVAPILVLQRGRPGQEVAALVAGDLGDLSEVVSSVPSPQYLHLGATMLVAVATAMLVAPAAYHRRVEPESVSRQFVFLSTRLLRWSLIPLMFAVIADFYIVASVVTERSLASVVLSLMLLGVFLGLWYVVPSRAMTKH